MSKILDLDGLAHFWHKVKALINTKANKSEVTQLADAVNKISDSTTTTNGAFTKTKGKVITNISSDEPTTLDIGFTPKYFELLGIGGCSGLYLYWDKTNGWTGYAGPLYDYDVDMDNNTVTISTHLTMQGDFIWHAFG